MSHSIRFLFSPIEQYTSQDIKNDYIIGFLRLLCIFWYIKSLILTENKLIFAVPGLDAVIKYPLRAALSQSKCLDPDGRTVVQLVVKL